VIYLKYRSLVMSESSAFQKNMILNFLKKNGQDAYGITRN
jgi:hypothetical protein